MTKESAKETIWLTEEQLAALVQPRTREVFEAFREHGPMPVDELQRRLECPSKTLYYQVDKLKRAGLLVEAGASKGSRRDRAVYRAVEGPFKMPDGFQGARYERLAARGVTATLRGVIRSFQEAAEQSGGDLTLADDLLILTSGLRLSSEQISELKERLRGLFEEFQQRSSPDGRFVSAVSVITPHPSRLK